MKCALFLSLFFLSAFGQNFAYVSNANATLSNGNNFSYRNVQFVEVSLPPIVSAAEVIAESVALNPTSLSIDLLFALAYVALNKAPTVYVQFFDAAAKYVPINPATNTTSANVTASEAYIGTSFISLNEVTPNGTTVATIPLVDLLWSISGQSITGDPKYITFQGKNIIFYPNLVVSISFVGTAHVGLLNVGTVSVVTPNSIETVVNITNFPYNSVANSVKLNIGVASQASTVTVTTQYTQFSGGTGNGATFFSLNNQVLAGGTVQPAKISGFVDVDDTATLANSDIVAQATAKYAAAASFKIVSVTFPAGASSIVYDPSTGSGAPPPAIVGTSGANGITVSFALLILLITLLL